MYKFDVIYTSNYVSPNGNVLLTYVMYARTREQAIHRARMRFPRTEWDIISVNQRDSDLY
jgi:hypothetical protein